MIGNLPEQFLYERLPAAVINSDERGHIEAVCSGFQDRLEDVRSFAKKINEFWVPGSLPDSTTANVILVNLISEQGKNFTRSLDIDATTPVTAGAALTLWAAKQLQIPVEDVSNVRYGYDALRQVDVNVLSALAATLGTMLYRTDLMEDQSAVEAAQVDLVDTWFPRLKIKGTVESFEVLGRILGFDDVRVTPLWTRLSPRIPEDVGAPENDPDFAYHPDYYPRQEIGPYYDPFDYRDGPFYSWTGTASTGTANTSFYTQTITDHNPWIDVVILGSIVGTNLPSIQFGTVVHPAAGSYMLTGGAPYSKAYVDPFGSSIRFQAIAEGADFNGLFVHVATSGTYAFITVDDRLSAIKYRSSFFDLGLTADMDKVEDIFGSRAATTNKDLRDDPTLTADGTAASPYRPWVSGSIAVAQMTTDWVTVDGTIPTSTVAARRSADPAAPYHDRQMNMEAVVTTGIQVTQAFEEVRAATRLPRRSEAGFLIDDPACYAPYTTGTLLFTTTVATSYAGSSAAAPLPAYVADIHAIFASGTRINLVSEINPLNQNAYYYGGTYPAGTYAINGSYNFSTGSYAFVTTVQSGVKVYADWTVTSTDVVRPEPTATTKSAGTLACLGRPEDDDSGLLDEVADDFPWRREVTAGGELVELDIYRTGTEIAVQVLEEATAFNDHTGVDVDVFVMPSVLTPKPRVSWHYRTTAFDAYHPGYLAVGYQGVLKNLATLTSNETKFIRPPTGPSVGDTATDYDVLFQPGYKLYHIGLAQGVLVADLPKFFGAQHADGLVGWFAFNEHIDDDLAVKDHSFHDTPCELTGLEYTNRVWDAERGWHMNMTAQSRVFADEYRDIVDKMSLSFWIKVGTLPASETTIVNNIPVYFTLNGSGSLTGYAYEASGTAVALGAVPVANGAWNFVYIRRDATNATFGIGTLSGTNVETTVGGAFLTTDSGTNTALVVESSGTESFHVHDLRIWNVQKTAAEMNLVRYHAPNPTICTYRMGFMYTLSRQDKFGIKVLPSGWAEPDVMPAWMRRTQQGLVTRYDSMGSYIGETRFKEVGIGDHRALPDKYVLGQQFVTLVGEGTAPFSTGVGAMPGWNPLWQASNSNGNYLVLPFAGSTATGIVPVVTPSGTVTPWPNSMAQTNPFRQYVYVNTTQGTAVYQLSLDGSGIPSGGSETWLQAVPVTRNRTQAEIEVDPYYKQLVTTGSVYAVFGTGYITGTLVNGNGTYGYFDPTTATYYPKVFSGSDLYISEEPTGAYVLLSSGAVSLQANPFTYRGVAGAYTGTNATPPLYMYTNSRIAAQVPNPPITLNAAWTGGGNTTTPRDNKVTPDALPKILTVDAYGTWLNTPVLGKPGVLEFANAGVLVPGPYELTVVSGQIGQADPDFDGFSVEINVNDTIFQRRLLRGMGGYNFSGTNIFRFDLQAGVTGNYLISFDWTNAAEDESKGTKRQLAIFGYTLRHITTDLFRVSVAPLTITPLGLKNFSAGTTPGGWYNTVNSYGTSVGYAHEASLYRENDTVTAIYPVGDTLTGLTNERRNDVIYTGPDIVIAQEGSFTFPTFDGVYEYVASYDGTLVWFRQGLGMFLEVNPAGARDLSFGTNFVTEVHGHNLLLLTGLTVSNSPVLTEVDLINCTSMVDFTMDNCPAIPVLSLGFMSNGQTISLQNNALLSNLNLSNLTTVDDFVLTNSPLKTLALPVLTTATTQLFAYGLPQLTSLYAPLLTTAGDISLTENTAITAYSLPKLTNVSGSIDMSGCDALTVVSLPQLTSLNTFYIYNNPTLASLSLPSLQTLVGGYYGANNPSLASLDLPAFSGPLGLYFDMTANATLLSVTFNVPLRNTGQFLLVGDALNQATVDRFLQAGINGGMTSGVIDLHAGISAFPSATGIANKTTLLANGVTVRTNDDPYDHLLVYKRQGFGETIILNPTGAYNLTFGSNPVTEVHAHNCPALTGITLNNSPVLTLVDIANCPALKDWTLDNCDALLTLDMSFMKTGGVVNVNNHALLQSINFSNLETCSRLAVGTNNALTTLSFPKLTVSTQIFFAYDNPALTVLSAPLLTSTGDFIIRNNDAITAYSFPALATVTTTFDVKDCALLASASFPVLVSTPSVQLQSNPVLAAVNFNSLQTWTTFQMTGAAAIVTLAFPARTTALSGTLNVDGCTSLTSITFNNRPLANGLVLSAVGDALSLATVDAILAAGIANAGMVTGNINLSGGTSAVPSTTGLNNKSTLIGRGVTVTTNVSTPFSGKLTYTRQGLGDTVVNNPVGVYNLTFGSNPVTAIHCQDCALITSLTCQNSAVFTVLDLKNVITLDVFDFTNSDGLIACDLSQLNNPVLGNITVTGCQVLQVINLTGITQAGVLTLHTNPALVTFTAPALQTVTSLNLGATGLTSLTLPALTTINAGFAANACPSLLTASFPVLTTVTSDFTLQGNTVMQSVSCPLLTSCPTFQVYANPALTTLTLTNLTTVTTSLNLYQNTALPSLTLPALVTVGGGFNLTTLSVAATISMPALTTVGGALQYGQAYAATTISFPLLRTIGANINGLQCNAVAVVNFSALQTIGPGPNNLNDCANQTAINWPAFTGNVASVIASTGPKVAAFNYNGKNFANGAQIQFIGCALTQAEVDKILATGVASGMTSGNINLSGGTNAFPSPVGMANKATLIANGVTVTTNVSSDPYYGVLVYIRQGLGTTTVINPTGVYNLTFGANPVTEIHCHDCPAITSLTSNDSAVLTIVDLARLSGLGTLILNNNAALTSLNLSTFTTFTTLQVIASATLASINLSALASVTGDLFLYQNALTTIVLPALVSVGGNLNTFTNATATTVSFPALTTVGGYLHYGQAHAATLIEFPLLRTIGANINGLQNEQLTAVNFNSLQSIGTGPNNFDGCTKLTSLNWPAYLSTVKSVIAPACAALTSFNYNGKLFVNGSAFQFQGCALTQAEVDKILATGVASGMTSGTIDLSLGTNAVPSAAGVANKATLVANGVTVITNYDNIMVYTRQGLGQTIVTNPSGAINLTFGANPVIDVHAHNCPGITSFMIANSTVLTTVDFKNCPNLNDFTMNDCTAITSVDMSFMSGPKGSIIIQRCGLTSFSLPNVTTLAAFQMTACPCTTVSLASLTSTAQMCWCYEMPEVINPSFPVLASTDHLSVRNNLKMVTLSTPSLVTAVQNYDYLECPLLTSVSAPALTTATSIFGYSCASLLTVNFAALRTLTNYNGGNNIKLTALALPAYTGAFPTGFTLTGCTVLTTVSFNNRPLKAGVNFAASGCALNQATVDLILQAGISAGAGMTSGTINLTGGTSAVPSNAGLINKSTLVSQGVNVTTNIANPFSGKLVYTRQGLGDTTVANPVGVYDLSFGSNPVTAIHCRDCAKITAMNCNNDAVLTTVDLYNLPAVTAVAFINVDALTALDLSSFTSLTTLQVYSNQVMASLNLAALVTVGTFNVYDNPALVALSAPQLTTATEINFWANVGMTTLSLPALTTVTNMIAYTCSTLVTINFAALRSVVTGFNLGNSPTVPGVSWPSYSTAMPDQYVVDADPACTNVFFNNRPLKNGMTCSAPGCALPQAVVDMVLAAGVAGGMTSGTIRLNGGTNSVPSATGLANKNTLVAAGVSVLTN